VRFGLVGTGHWAQVTQGMGLAAEPSAELAAVWGHTPEHATALADELGVPAAGSYDELVERVDAVAFAVPPDVQAELAVQAAEAGRHVLLEKPVATSLAGADRLVAAVEGSGVASVVFFTSRFDRARREWLAGVQGEPWEGGWSRWFAPIFPPTSPYAGSSWRRERGALWDLGPHLLSLLVPPLGRVAEVAAVAGAGDLVHLVFGHESGATSTASTTLRAPAAAAGMEVGLWGPAGVATLPPQSGSSADCLRVAARELIEEVASGRRSHPCDVHFGREVVRVLAEAEQVLGQRAKLS
jgi:predicted dehydrogenase